MRFSYTGEPFREQDAGLVLILTCSKCGEQLRVHQTSEAYRAERAKLPALLAAAKDARDVLDIDHPPFVKALAAFGVVR